MTNMVERVARAMAGAQGVRWPDIGGPGTPLRQAYLKMARAAIQAMREPTEAMVDSAYTRDDDSTGYVATPDVYWQAMIDAALTEE